MRIFKDSWSSGTLSTRWSVYWIFKPSVKDVMVLVVQDEAYIEFSSLQSSMSWLKKHDNLIVLRTFSKIAGLWFCVVLFGKLVSNFSERTKKFAALRLWFLFVLFMTLSSDPAPPSSSVSAPYLSPRSPDRMPRPFPFLYFPDLSRGVPCVRTLSLHWFETTWRGNRQGIGHHFSPHRIQKLTPVLTSISLSAAASKKPGRERERGELKGEKKQACSATVCVLSCFFFF
jgi:hypothetical protein